MAETLDYASAECQSTNRRWIGWTACVITIVVSFWMGVGSLVGAHEFHQYFAKGLIAAGRTSEDLIIERLLNTIAGSVCLCLAFIGRIICWRRATGRRWALGALLIGVACWIASLALYY